MDAIIFTKDQFTDLMSKLDTIQSQISIKADPKKETFLDNQEFLLLMKISKRTAQTWRDEGKISFSQVETKSTTNFLMLKSYYKSITTNHLKDDSMSDVMELVKFVSVRQAQT
jgi:hypothetical protein